MKQFKYVLLTIIVILFIAFIFQNFTSVTITFFKWSVTLPLAFTATAMYILGMFTGGLLWSNLKKLTKHNNNN